jgi:U6 snRNA-associated Sm-like protein LSm7
MSKFAHAKEEKKECIMNLAEYAGKIVSIEIVGGRVIKGVLRGYDETSNIALDDAFEYIPSAFESVHQFHKGKRALGFIFIRGQTVMTIYAEDSAKEITNPFVKE